MPPDSADPLAPDPDRDVILDAAALRVLAHPMRLNLLNGLREHGPSTARLLAKRFDLDSGAASYHLRRLAAGGLIEEDEERGTRRDRWWRARHRSSFHDPAALPAAEQADSRAYAHALVLAYSDRLRTVAGTVPLLPDDWFAASMFSNTTLRLSPDEANQMKRELVEVISTYRERGSGPAGTAELDATNSVSVQLQIFPLP